MSADVIAEGIARLEARLERMPAAEKHVQDTFSGKQRDNRLAYLAKSKKLIEAKLAKLKGQPSEE